MQQQLTLQKLINNFLSYLYVRLVNILSFILYGPYRMQLIIDWLVKLTHIWCKDDYNPINYFIIDVRSPGYEVQSFKPYYYKL